MCWKGKASNYEDVLHYINNARSDKLKEFEGKLADTSIFNYKIYEYRYKDKMTFAEIVKVMKLDSTARVSEALNAISLAIQIFFA